MDPSHSLDSASAGALLIGTRKGVFFLVANEDRSDWALDGPHFLGHVAQHVALDPRDNTRLVVGARTGHLGPTVFWSDDLGANWNESSKPPAFHTGEELARSVDEVVWVAPGHSSQPGVWYAGASPQGLFISEDGGDTWKPHDGWNNHPMWPSWCEWPIAQTPDGSMLHSINIDPRDADHLIIGLSSGGVFESVDAGADWHRLNSGMARAFEPEPGDDTEEGHDPHCVRMHPARPDRLYQQNHCGIYRMDRTGDIATDHWERIGDAMPQEIGDIGFPIELHPRDPDTAWVFPMDGTDVWPRTSPDGRPAVYKTGDAGASWQRQDTGLPALGWPTVLRQSMTVDSHDQIGVYFGTTSGEVWASVDEGEHWKCVASHLPEIYSVEFGRPVTA